MLYWGRRFNCTILTIPSGFFCILTNSAFLFPLFSLRTRIYMATGERKRIMQVNHHHRHKIMLVYILDKFSYAPTILEILALLSKLIITQQTFSFMDGRKKKAWEEAREKESSLWKLYTVFEILCHFLQKARSYD